MYKLIVIFMLSTFMLSCESPPIEEPIEPVKCVYEEWQKERDKFSCRVTDSFYFTGYVQGREWKASSINAVVNPLYKYYVGMNISVLVPGDSCSAFILLMYHHERFWFRGIRDTIFFRNETFKCLGFVELVHYNSNGNNQVYLIKEGDSLSTSNFITLDWINKDSTEVAGSFAFTLWQKIRPDLSSLMAGSEPRHVTNRENDITQILFYKYQKMT